MKSNEIDVAALATEIKKREDTIADLQAANEADKQTLAAALNMQTETPKKTRRGRKPAKSKE